jgi:hypothetical protein
MGVVSDALTKDGFLTSSLFFRRTFNCPIQSLKIKQLIIGKKTYKMLGNIWKISFLDEIIGKKRLNNGIYDTKAGFEPGVLKSEKLEIEQKDLKFSTR